MSRVEFWEPDPCFKVSPERTRLNNRVVRLDMSQVELLSTVLSRALQHEPHFKYLLPDEQVRHTVLSWFFRSVALRACHLYGETYTTESIEAGALWISPVHTLAFEQFVREEIMAIPFKLARVSLRRYTNFAARIEAVRKRFAEGPHWYLMALAVEPPKAEQSIGNALLEPVLSRADSEGLPCYLETFHEKHLPFYEACGFRVQGAGQIPRGGPNFWAMMRKPQ